MTNPTRAFFKKLSIFAFIQNRHHPSKPTGTRQMLLKALSQTLVKEQGFKFTVD